MRRAVILVAGLFLVFGAVGAQAVEMAPPAVEVWVDGAQVGSAVPVLDTTTGQWIIENYYYSGAEGQITLNAALDPDPSILYAMSVVDFGGPSVFGFVFGLPIVATAAPGIVTHSGSVGGLIFWHAFFNLGMVTGILPVVGVTLPLFSAGGSSVLTIMLGIGLLMNVSMRRFWISPARTTGLLSRG